MKDPQPALRYRFGLYEADAATSELRKQGVRIKLNAQPFQVLLMLLANPGQLLTREEISRDLWPDGTFIDFEHGVNSAVNRIREALGDTASNPRFVETLARRGYRFVAPVERIPLNEDSSSTTTEQAASAQTIIPVEHESNPRLRILASPQELPKASFPVVQTLFILLQFMYLGFYIGALANLAEIEDLFSLLSKATQALTILIVTAAILIPVRAFVLSASLFHAPGAREKFLRIWPFLLVLDELWSLSPFLLLHHINFGLALACATLLVYSPFAQRSLILMGAGGADAAIVHTR
ncbi:MAG: winged helix-turn-helix domain-containing protein [Terracidiphilus sp.]